MCAWGDGGGKKKKLDAPLPQMELPAVVSQLMWVLGIKLGLFGREAGILNNGAISPVPQYPAQLFFIAEHINLEISACVL